MHHFHDDQFTGIELGVCFTTLGIGVDGWGRGWGGTGGGKPAPTRTTALHERDAKVEGKTKAVPVTPTDQAKEAIKDGKLTEQEKTAFRKAPVAKEVVKDEQKRLKDAVAKAEGAPEHLRGRDGKLVLDGKGKALPVGYDSDVTDHERRTAALRKGKDKQGLDALDTEIRAIEGSGQTLGLEALRKQRADRAAEEQKVAAVIEDKESLVGTLEVEKEELTGAANPNAKDDFQALRERSKKWEDQFNANGGQYYQGNDALGDDWDTEKVDFDKLAARFYDHPEKLEEFARVQGRKDSAGGRTRADMERHIADVAKDDPKQAREISLRYQAAEELQKIFTQYNEARQDVERNGTRVREIDAEIAILNESKEQDRAALSTETLAKLEKHNRPVEGIIPDDAGAADDAASGEDTATSASDAASADDATSGNDGAPVDADAPGDAAGADDAGAPAGDVPSTPGQAPIDYSIPEHREQVLTQARERNLVPAQHTTFNEQGQAVYTVQRNDSYWRIADMSDGKPPHEFDFSHFAATVATNSERFGRDPRVGLIHPNEQVVIPGRSIEELVVLMGLPTTQPVEEEPVDEQMLAPEGH